MQLQCSPTPNQIVQVGQTILFDKILLQSDSDDIQYNPVTGSISLNQPGDYLVDWSLVTNSVPSGAPMLALETFDGEIIFGGSSQKQGIISSTAILSVDSPGYSFSLVNQTAQLVYPTGGVLANLVVYSVHDTVSGGVAGTFTPSYMAFQIPFPSIVTSGSASAISLNAWYGPRYLRLMGEFTLADNTSLTMGSAPLISAAANSGIFNALGIGQALNYTGKWPVYPKTGLMTTGNLCITVDHLFSPGIIFSSNGFTTFGKGNTYYFDFTMIV